MKESISGPYFHSAYQSCIEAGCDAEALLSSANLDAQAVQNPLQRVPGTAFLNMLHAAEAALGETGIGLKIGKNFRPDTFRDLGYVAMSCANIIEAKNLNTKYQRLTQTVGTSRIEITGEMAAIIWRPDSQDHEFFRPMTDAIFAGYITLGLWMNWIGVGNAVSVLQFCHGPTHYAHEFEQAFNCKIQFNASRNAIVFDAAIARIAFPQHNPEFVAIICKRLDRALAQLDAGQTIREQIYDMLEVMLPNGVPTIGHIAGLIGMSERTLRRKLSGENISYRQIVQDVRRDSCDIHLKDPNVSLAQFAQKLGYSEQSAFSHAFRGWHGMTPGQYAKLKQTG